MAWAGPSPLWMAAPPAKAAAIKDARAASPSGSSAARISANTRAIPSKARASITGLAGSAKKPSMQWDSASMPVAAISRRGKVRTRSGSQIATRGTRKGLRVPIAGPPASVCSAETGELSLPVPAVVGMAISGATVGLMRSGRPSSSAEVDKSVPASAASILAVSITEPPPSATTPSHAPSR